MASPSRQDSDRADGRAQLFRTLWIAASSIVLFYAAAMMWYAIELSRGELPSALNLLAWITDVEVDYFTPVFEVFRRNLGAMTLHIVLGAGVLMLGTSQFVPSWRRRWPRIHRTAGVLVIAGMYGTVISAVVRLLAEPADNTYSGPAFDGVLWYLAGVSFFTTTQAARALVQRAWRQHVLWMALAWSSYLTAPSLRLNVITMHGIYGGDPEHLNFASGAVAWVATSLLMALWLQFVGDKDRPGTTSRTTHWPAGVIWALAISGAAVSLHEGVLAPLGLDTVANVRGAVPALPRTALLWGMAMPVAAIGAVPALRASVEGTRPVRWWHLSVLLAAVGALVIAADAPNNGLLLKPVSATFLSLGLSLLGLLFAAAVGRANTLGRMPWAICLTFVAWSPASVPIVILFALPLGMHFDELYTLALILGPTSAMLLGVATAFGARLGTLAVRPGKTLTPLATALHAQERPVDS